MAEYTEVLAKKNFFYLWIGQIISQFGDRLTQMALIGLIYSLYPGSSWQLAKPLAFTIIPVFIFGPIAGVFVDRWDRRLTMLGADAIRALLVLSIPLFLINYGKLWPIYIVMFLSFTMSRFFVPAKLSVIPDLVDEDEIFVANSLTNTTGILAAGLGFILGGILVDYLGPRGGFAINGITYIASALFIFLISKSVIKGRKEGFSVAIRDTFGAFRSTVLKDLREGTRYLFLDSNLRSVMVLFFGIFSGLGCVYVSWIVFIQRSLGSVTKDVGLLIGFLSAGAFLGALFYGKIAEHIKIFRAMFSSMTLGGVTIGLMSVLLPIFSYFWLAALLSFSTGLVLSPLVVASQSLIHKVSKQHLRGRVFSVMEIVIHAGFLIFMLISSKVAEIIHERIVLLAVAVVFFLWGMTGMIKSRDYA